MPYEVNAFPTMFYFQRGKLQFKYNHGHKKEDILNFLDNPTETRKSDVWSEKEDSKTVHLTNETYDSQSSKCYTVLNGIQIYYTLFFPPTRPPTRPKI